MQCPWCRTENSEDAVSCAHCGARFSATCARCSAVLPEGAKFCHECDQPQSAATSAASGLLAPGFALVHPNGVVISPGVHLGRGVRVHRGVGFGTVGYDDPNKDGMPTVGDEAVIFDGAKVLGPIHVGEHAVVGANAILIRSLPPGAIVAVPSPRVIGYQ